ncbi:MAG: Gfo/Idh/MocA family oxidoreductase [Gammaproteobacteria bacterium]|nr:Gfo/Idh/MocA family oxidoreductase [Gammaproteobacteria bacterium]
MADKLGIGIIGAGHISASHLKGLGGTPEAVCRGIVDIVGEKATARAEEFGVPDKGTDYRVLLDDPRRGRRDRLHAAVRPRRADHRRARSGQARALREALRAGRGRGEGDGRGVGAGGQVAGHGLGSVAAASGTAGGAGLVADGKLGRVYHARTTFLRQRGRPAIDILKGINWFVNREFAGGGSFIDIGVYELDIMMWLMNNAQPVSVLAAMTDQIGGPPPEGGHRVMSSTTPR